MSKYLLLLSCCGLLLLLAVQPSVAGPLPPEDKCLTDNICRARYNQALQLFEEGRFESALPVFRAAYQRRQMPWLLINIGRTLYRLGRSKEALEHYERFSRVVPKTDPETQERLQRYIEQARMLSDSSTTVTPPAAPPVSPTPAPPTAVPPSPVPEQVAAPATTDAPAVVAPPPAPPKDQPTPLYKKWWFWTAVGGGVAAVVVIGAVAGAAASQPGGLPDGVPKVTFSF